MKYRSALRSPTSLLIGVLVACLAIVSCSGDDPTRPQLAEDSLLSAGALVTPDLVDGRDIGVDSDSESSAFAAEFGSFGPDEIDTSDREYDGEDGPIEHVVRVQNGLELVFRFNGRIRAREEVSITLRVPTGGMAFRGEVAVDFGDGRRTQKYDIDRAVELTHTYRDQGRYRIFVIVVADDGRKARGGFRLAVADRLYVDLDVEPVDRIRPGEEARVQFVATTRKRANKARGTLNVDWGDGSTEVVDGFDGAVIRPHTYEKEGDYQVKLMLDVNGRQFEHSEPVEVNDGPDELDLSQAIVMGNSAQDIATWTVTSEVLGVTISGSEICIDHTKAGGWPVWDGVEGNPWIVANIGGQWYAGTYEWVRPGQICKGITARNVGPHIKFPPMISWAPQKGELVYFFVSTVSRLGARSSNERSNVVAIIWPY